MSPEQIMDVLDCGNPQESWQTMVGHYRHRARLSREIAKKLRADAEDALSRAVEHDDAGRDFDGLADAMEGASVTFPKGDVVLPGPPRQTRPQGHSVIA